MYKPGICVNKSMYVFGIKNISFSWTKLSDYIVYGSPIKSLLNSREVVGLNRDRHAAGEIWIVYKIQIGTFPIRAYDFYLTWLLKQIQLKIFIPSFLRIRCNDFVDG